MYYRTYIFMERVRLGPDNPKGIPWFLFRYDVRDMVDTINWYESVQTYGRIVVWIPLKFYFYLVSKRFLKECGVLDEPKVQMNYSLKQLVFGRHR